VKVVPVAKFNKLKVKFRYILKHMYTEKYKNTYPSIYLHMSAITDVHIV